MIIRRYQIKPKTSNHQAQGKPLTRIVGTQYEQQDVEETFEADSDDNTDDDEYIEYDGHKQADGDYIPDDESCSDSDIDDKLHMDEPNELLSVGEPHKERHFQVSESSFLELLNK